MARTKITARKSTGGGPPGAKRRKRRTETFSRYIFKILKQVHPETGISKRGMLVVNSFVYDLFERIAREAGQLARYNKKSTLSSREVQSAIRLVLPGELSKHAAVEGTRILTKYITTIKLNKK